MEGVSRLAKHERSVCLDPDLIEVQGFACEARAQMERPLFNRGFDKALLEAVDEGLVWLGDATRRTIYYHLENGFNIRRQDIPYQIEGFADAIEKIFGAAAALLEIQIMKKLYEKVGGPLKYLPEQQDLVFTEYVETIRLSYLNKLL
jgi:hypothetical protein